MASDLCIIDNESTRALTSHHLAKPQSLMMFVSSSIYDVFHQAKYTPFAQDGLS